MSELVTTIIPTFRRPYLLRRAIASALNQTYRDVQVCVYDNASGDETQAAVAQIASLDSRVRYFCHPQPVPVARNFQFGMERVETPYFSFLSDDDVLFPTFYASAIARLMKDPDALFAAGSALEFDEAGAVRYAPLALWSREGRYVPPEGFLAMLGNRHPTLTAILFRQGVIEKVGAIDAEVAGPADLDYELRVASRFAYEVFFEPSAAYVHHANRLSAVEDASAISGYERIAAKLSADTRIDSALRANIPSMLARQIRRKLYEIAVKSIVAGNDKNAEAAATALRERYSRPVTASVIRTAIATCRTIPGVRGALASVESARVARRAREAQRLLRASIGQDGSAYAKYILAP